MHVGVGTPAIELWADVWELTRTKRSLCLLLIDRLECHAILRLKRRLLS